MKSPISADPAATILATAQELCGMLGFETSSIKEVLWSDFPVRVLRSSKKIPLRPPSRRISGPKISAHYPLLIHNDNTLVLREMMKGRLEIEDWKPLLCASLIFYKQLGRKRNRKKKLLLRVPIMTILGFAAINEIVYFLFGYSVIPIQYFEILVPFGAVIAISLWAYFASRIDRREALEADRKTAKLLGKEHFKGVLEKIEAMRQSDVAEGRQEEWRDFPPFVPSLAIRIQNLPELVV